MPRLAIGVLVVMTSLIGLAACARDEAAARRAADRALALQPAPAPFRCHDLRALIPRNGSVEGTTCPQNKAVVNGWSELCVAAGQCNTPARLGEINQAAEDFCANWCAQKSCAYRYTQHTACDSSWCLNSTECLLHCDAPLLDACFFQQRAPNYNCECRERVQN